MTRPRNGVESSTIFRLRAGFSALEADAGEVPPGLLGPPAGPRSAAQELLRLHLEAGGSAAKMAAVVAPFNGGEAACRRALVAWDAGLLGPFEPRLQLVK